MGNRASIESLFATAAREGWDELDAVLEFFGRGYTLDDLAYDKERQRYVKEFAKTHGLI